MIYSLRFKVMPEGEHPAAFCITTTRPHQ